MRKLIVGMTLWFSLFAHAEAPSDFRMGIGLGTPFVPSFMAEFWSDNFPIVVRANAGTLVFASGGNADIAVAVDNSGDFRQYVGVGGETGYFVGGWTIAAWGGVGPKYGIRASNFYADVGVAIGDGRAFSFPFFYRVRVLPSVHVGYAFEL